MNFKVWLESWMNITNAHSWLDEKGNFYPVSDKHHTWSIKNGYNMEDLFAKGWMRITFIGNELIVCNDEGKLLNRNQSNNLIDFAIANTKFNYILFDDGEDQKIVWQREDY